MPIFNKKSYKNFSEIIASSYEYLKNFHQDTEYLNLRKNILSDAKKYNRKNDELLKRIWFDRTKNGVANITSNSFSKAEFQNNTSVLHNLSIQIKNDKNYDVYKNAISELESLRDNKSIRHLYKASVARTFATFHPNLFINWVTDKNIKQILQIFSNFEDIKLKDVNQKSDWYTISYKLMSAINKINNKRLEPENIRLLITQIYLQNREIESSNKSRKKIDKKAPKSTTRKAVDAMDVKLNENGVLKKIFCDWLEKKKIYDDILCEDGIDKGQRVDVSMTKSQSGVRVLCELKWINDIDFKQKIRMAVGQLLEYQFYDKSNNSELWLVINQPPEKKYVEYLNALKERMNESFHVYVLKSDDLNFKCLI